MTHTKIPKREKGMTARQIAAKKYYDKNYRSKGSRNNRWQAAFLGHIKYEELCRIYNIIPE